MKIISLLLTLLLQLFIENTSYADSTSIDWITHESTYLKIFFSYPNMWSIDEDETSLSLRRLLKEKNQVVFISFNNIKDTQNID